MNEGLTRREFLKGSLILPSLYLLALEGCGVSNFEGIDLLKRDINNLDIDPTEFDNSSRLNPLFVFNNDNRVRAQDELVKPGSFNRIKLLSRLKTKDLSDDTNQLIDRISGKVDQWQSDYAKAVTSFKQGDLQIHFVPMLHDLDILSGTKFEEFVKLSQLGVFKILSKINANIVGLESGHLPETTLSNIGLQGEQKYSYNNRSIDALGIKKARDTETAWFKTRGVGKYYLANPERVKVVGMEDIDYAFFRGLLVELLGSIDESKRQIIMGYQTLSSMLGFSRVVNKIVDSGQKHGSVAFGVAHLSDFLRIQALTGGNMSIYDSVPNNLSGLRSKGAILEFDTKQIVSEIK